jgi:hypothetical protein
VATGWKLFISVAGVVSVVGVVAGWGFLVRVVGVARVAGVVGVVGVVATSWGFFVESLHMPFRLHILEK